MNTNTDANELLDRSAALLQSQSTLIDTLLRRCKDLHNDAEILRGTVKATVAERDELRAKLAESERVVEEFKSALNRCSNIPPAQIDEILRCRDAHIAAVEKERDGLRAKLANAERRADEMEGKAGEWIAVDVHKDRMGRLAAFAKVAFDRAPRVEQKADGFWLILSNATIRVPEPRSDIGYKAFVDAIEQQKQDRAVLNVAGVEVSS